MSATKNSSTTTTTAVASADVSATAETSFTATALAESVHSSEHNNVGGIANSGQEASACSAKVPAQLSDVSAHTSRICNVLLNAHMFPDISADLVRRVQQFMVSDVRKFPNVEVEGKLGTILCRAAAGGAAKWKRSHVGVDGRLVIAERQPNQRKRFESNITDAGVYKRLNELLNGRYAYCRTHHGKIAGVPNATYSHTRTLDRFYSLRGRRIRETLDEGSGELQCIIMKNKLNHMDMHNCRDMHDIRISTAIEQRMKSLPPNVGHPIMMRRKDRVSYCFGIWSVDITAVSNYSRIGAGGQPIGAPEHSHEVELEIADMKYFNSQRILAGRGRANTLFDIVYAFLDNLLTLSRCCEASFATPESCSAPMAHRKRKSNRADKSAGATKRPRNFKNRHA